MSSDEEDAVLGRLMRQKKEAERRMATLRAEADRLAETFKQIALCLESNPEAIYFNGEGVEGEFLGVAKRFNEADFQGTKKVIDLADDYRATIKELTRISERLREAGVD